MLKFIVRPALGVCVLLCALLLSPALPASAARYQVDITCDQMTKLPGDAVTMLSLWLPGWWSARHNDPYVNAWRVTELVKHLGNVCYSAQNKHILSIVRAFKDMPKVPDNGLLYKCQDFLTASLQWQTILTLWLQGYVAGETGDTFLDSGYASTISSYEAQCRRDPKQNMGQVARIVGKRAR